MGHRRLLYICANEDETLRGQLEKHLTSLVREGLIASWHVGLLLPGSDVQRALVREVELADIVLLLLSADLLASALCHWLLAQVQQQSTLRRITIVPIIARPVDFGGIDLGHQQPLPQGGVAVTLWSNQDAAWLDVVRSLRSLLPRPAPLVAREEVEYTALRSAAGGERGSGTENPYTPSKRALFYGRSALMEQLSGLERAAQSVVLFGGRRCGKTRLLEAFHLQLRQRWIEDVWAHWPTLIDLQGLAVDSLLDLLGVLAHRIHDAVPDRSELLGRPASAMSSVDFENWLIEVDRSPAIRAHAGIALLIDEVEVILERPWGHDFMQLLRRLDDHTFRARIWILMVGADRLDSYKDPEDGSPALNTTRRLNLEGLDYDARKAMIHEPFARAGRLPPSTRVTREIDRLAGGNVWLLTLMLERYFDEKVGPLSNVERIAEELLDEMSDVMRGWAAAIGDKGIKIYEMLYRGDLEEVEALRGHEQRRARRRLLYHALIHQPRPGLLEIGPELFRDWAMENDVISPLGHSQSPPPLRRGPLPPGRYHYDIALSYALEDKALVMNVADTLSANGLKVFFDREISGNLYGAELRRYLPDGAGREAELAVILLSEQFALRAWPLIAERDLIIRALRDDWEALRVVSLDGARLPAAPDAAAWLEVASERLPERLLAELGALLRGRAA